MGEIAWSERMVTVLDAIIPCSVEVDSTMILRRLAGSSDDAIRQPLAPIELILNQDSR